MSNELTNWLLAVYFSVVTVLYVTIGIQLKLNGGGDGDARPISLLVFSALWPLNVTILLVSLAVYGLSKLVVLAMGLYTGYRLRKTEKRLEKGRKAREGYGDEECPRCGSCEIGFTEEGLLQCEDCGYHEYCE